MSTKAERKAILRQNCAMWKETRKEERIKFNMFLVPAQIICIITDPDKVIN